MSVEIKQINQLPEDFQNINPHNLYLYVKAYLANQRAGTAHTKTRGEVSGGGKKPFRQKGLGRARQGSIRAPHFVGGGVAHGPRNERDWSQKINKKQKRVALKYALNEKAENGKIYVVDSIKIDSGKTKDAVKWLNNINERDYLIVVDEMDEKTFLAFRNIPNVYIITPEELNAYYASVFKSIIFDKAAFDKVIKG
ncbi:50S ribosomal protein L4 [Caminibacter pacificus]|uniref:Large ribosomal subunit protein uL4 n=1 Tax=Caminibacter pacificus TaxID=1424653 RepID=A0AAJ4RBK8_9BACT|nr:50S ribosomal protein L4 [Caminibacter pacificus]QCI29005.1 50S ribosomal protein L4 [Caminibacter pacificus]ROR39186.1 large subunit ribosomal protein L4 [Caminibacter pacificus]